MALSVKHNTNICCTTLVNLNRAGARRSMRSARERQLDSGGCLSQDLDYIMNIC